MAALFDVNLPGVVLAEIVSGSNVSPKPFELGGGSAAMVLVYLVLLCLIGAAVIFFFRKYRPNAAKGPGRLSVLETRMLGGRQFLVVGKYGEKTFLLGVCPGKIEYLCDLPGDSSDPADGNSEQKFAGMLRDEEAKGKA